MLALTAAPAGAEPNSTNAYPPPTPCATSVLTGTFEPGATLEIQSTGFTPNGEAEILLHSKTVDLLDTKADSSGTIVATVHIPSDLAAGQHSLEVKMPSRTCSLTLTNDKGVDASSASRGVDASKTQRSQPPATSTSSQGLAFTGFSAITSLIVVVALIGGGVLFLVLGRRRRA